MFTDLILADGKRDCSGYRKQREPVKKTFPRSNDPFCYLFTRKILVPATVLRLMYEWYGKYWHVTIFFDEVRVIYLFNRIEL